MLQANINRQGGISSVIAKLKSIDHFSQLEKAMEEDPRLETMIVRENDYYAEQSTGLTQLINGFGYLVAVIMAIGAIFGALNSMYSAVSVRSVEIATLRALGFGAWPVVVSVMLEARHDQTIPFCIKSMVTAKSNATWLNVVLFRVETV